MNKRSAHKVLQAGCLGIGMVTILSKSLGKRDAKMATTAGGPTLHRGKVVADAVLFGYPGILAHMGGKHCALGGKAQRNVHAKMGLNPETFAITAFDRIHKIEMRDYGQGF